MKIPYINEKKKDYALKAEAEHIGNKLKLAKPGSIRGNLLRKKIKKKLIIVHIKEKKNNIFTYITKSTIFKDLYKTRLYKKLKLKSSKRRGKKKLMKKLHKKHLIKYSKKNSAKNKRNLLKQVIKHKYLFKRFWQRKKRLFKKGLLPTIYDKNHKALQVDQALKIDEISRPAIYEKFKLKLNKDKRKRFKLFCKINLFELNLNFSRFSIGDRESIIIMLFKEFLKEVYPQINVLIGKFKSIFESKDLIKLKLKYPGRAYLFIFIKQCIRDFKKILNINGISLTLFLNQLQLYIKKKHQIISFKNNDILFYFFIAPLYIKKAHMNRIHKRQRVTPINIGEYSRIKQAKAKFYSPKMLPYYKQQEVDLKQFAKNYQKKNSIYNYVRGRLIQFSQLNLREVLHDQTLLRFRTNGNMGFSKKNRKLVMATTKLGRHIAYFLSKKKFKRYTFALMLYGPWTKHIKAFTLSIREFQPRFKYIINLYKFSHGEIPRKKKLRRV